MFILFYFFANLFVVFVSLLVYYATSSARKTHPRRLAKATERFSVLFRACKEGDDYHLPKREVNRLRHPLFLEAFYNACILLDDDQRQRVLLENQKPIIELQQQEKNPTIHAYFAYLLRDLRLSRENGGKYGSLMLRFLDDSSIYARENALKAIYSFGDAFLVENAFRNLSARGISHNEKLITDGLLTFPGDEMQLVELLMPHYDDLLECYRNSLINYMSYKAIDAYDDRLITDARKEDTSVDTVCAIIRKVNKSPSEKHLQLLEELIERYKDGDTWEPVAIAVTGLGHYLGNGKVKELLKNTLLSHNWYIRKNSAVSLVSIGISQEDLNEILDQHDQYAADAINYELGRAVHA